MMGDYGIWMGTSKVNMIAIEVGMSVQSSVMGPVDRNASKPSYAWTLLEVGTSFAFRDVLKSQERTSRRLSRGLH